MSSRAVHKFAVAPRLSFPTTGDSVWTWITLVLVGTILFVIYGRVLNAPLVMDDVIVIENNPAIARLWPLIGDPEHPGPLAPPKFTPMAGRPLVNLSFALNYHFGHAEPFGYRGVNVLLHILSAVILAALVRSTLQLEYFAGQYDSVAGPLSAGVALLWAVHPLQTEAIAYITQRTELLVSLCYLGTLYCAVRYWTAVQMGGRRLWLVLATATCLGGMASKEVMVTAPIIVLLYERTFLTGSFRRALKQSWPLYVGLALGWILLVVLNADGPRSREAGFDLGVTAYAHWLTQTKVLLVYLKLAVWPWPLVIHYEMPYLESIADAWPSLAPVSAFGIGTLILSWRRSALGFLGAWIWLILAPTLVVPIVTEVAAERRMYLPLAAIATLFVVGGYRLVWTISQWLLGNTQKTNLARPILGAVVAASVVCGAILTSLGTRRLDAYQNAVTLWSDALLHQPQDHAIRGGLGLALIDAGRPQEAIEHLEQALRMRPDADAHINLARAMLAVGCPERAIELYQWAIERQPTNAGTHYNLGMALVQAGRLQEAIEQCNEALRLRPDSIEAHYDLGIALASAGRSNEAISHYLAALCLSPDYVSAHVDLGNALLEIGRTQEAIEHYDQAIKIKPDFADAHADLGVARLRMGQPTVAIAHFRDAIRLRPELIEAHYNLAMALAMTGEADEAAAHFEAALKIKPDYAEAWANLATVRARQEQSSDALAAAEKALELARTQKNAMLVQQLETWLEAYRASLRSP